MKKILSIVIVAAMLIGCLAACGTPAKDDTADKAIAIELGKSGLTIVPEKVYEKGEITTDDTDENQVAYYHSEDTLVDFDVYEWAKATDETLADAVAEEAEEYGAEIKETKLGGLDAAYYYATEESDGETFDTVTYMIDNGDEFVELVFWLDGDKAQKEVDAMLATLTVTKKDAASGDAIELGKSGLKLQPEKAYEKGEITTDDTDENQVAYYHSDDTLVDFDVYEWAKATDETLADAVAEEAEEYGAEVKETKLGGLDAAFYYATEESDGETFDTVTYMIDNGDEFVELVFWLDGDDAQAEVDAILATLTK